MENASPWMKHFTLKPECDLCKEILSSNNPELTLRHLRLRHGYTEYDEPTDIIEIETDSLGCHDPQNFDIKKKSTKAIWWKIMSIFRERNKIQVY